MQREQEGRKMVWVGWTPPQQGWYTLNIDRCWQEKANIAGSGGLLRDHKGIWLRGFSIKLGHYTIEELSLHLITLNAKRFELIILNAQRLYI